MTETPARRLTHTVLIGIGGNIGDVPDTICLALNALNGRERIRVDAVSTVIVTKPVGPVSDQPDYYNAAAILATSLSPMEFLDALLDTERHLGRNRDNEIRFGPRPIDLDILLYDDIVCDTPRLTIPHPRMACRAFVLKPLAEIAPDYPHPILKKTVSELWREWRSGSGCRV